MNATLRADLRTRADLVRPRDGAAPAAVALALLAPLAVLPSAMNPYNFPKLLVMVVAIGVGALAPRRGTLPRLVKLVVAVGALVFVAAAIAGPGSPLPGLVGRWPRYEGLPTLAVYAGSAWLGARLLTEPSTSHGRSLQVWAAISAALLGAFSALDELGLSPLGWTSADRTGSLLGNATDQGLVAVLLGGLLLAPALRRRSPLLVVGLVSAIVTVALSGSRVAMLVTVLMVVIHGARLGSRYVRPLGATAVGLVVAVLALPQARDRLLNGATFESRVLAWQETLHLAADHWWLGVGPSGYTDAIGRYQDPEWVEVVGAAAKPDSPHSWPLQALAAGGIPLMLAALLLAGLVIRAGWRLVQTTAWDVTASHTQQAQVRAELALGLFASVTAYGVALLFNFTTPSTTCLAAFLTGALVGVPAAAEQRADEPARNRAAVTVLAAVGVLVLATACLTEVALRSGAELAATGRTRLAVERFELVERLRPWDTDARMLSAQYLAQQASSGDRLAAREAAHRARDSLGATPDSYESNVALGVSLIALGEAKPSLVVLDEAVVDYPFRAPAYVQRGIARVRLGDVAGGYKDLQRAAALRPDDPVPAQLLLDLRARLIVNAPLDAPLPPQTVTAVGRNRAATVSWTRIQDGIPILEYRVRSEPGGTVVTVPGTSTHARVKHLTNGRRYVFTVTAVNSQGRSTSLPSRPVTPATAPGRPPTPTVRVHGRSASLTWREPLHDGGARVASYAIVINGTTFELDAGDTSLTGHGLAPGRYTVRIAAVNAVGAGPLTPAISFRIPR